jgi:hypothetical protein
LLITKYCRRAGLVAQTFNTALKMNRITKFEITTAACLLAILCYGLPFHDNALGGLVKPTITVMAKSQKGGGQPPKKQNGGKVTNPKPPTATSDSTAYYKKQIKSFDALIAKEPNTAMGKSNKSVFLQERSKAYDALNRQSLKGKPGYDANGNPVKKKK